LITNPFTGQIITNKWTDEARRKSAEARKRKSMSSTKKGALIGAGVAGGANAAKQAGELALIKGVESNLPRDIPRGLLKRYWGRRAAGLGSAMLIGSLIGAGIGKLRQKKQD
jgi:hypothetical protein